VAGGKGQYAFAAGKKKQRREGETESPITRGDRHDTAKLAIVMDEICLGKAASGGIVKKHGRRTIDRSLEKPHRRTLLTRKKHAPARRRKRTNIAKTIGTGIPD